MWKVMSYLVPIVIIIGCAIGLISATGSKDKFTPTFVSDLIPRLDGKDVVDPFAGGGGGGANGGATSVPKWNTGGTMSGLAVTIVNAMTDDWAKFFDLVISDYEFGDPDTLTLSTEKAEADKECTLIPGMYFVGGTGGICAFRFESLYILDAHHTLIMMHKIILVS